MNVTAALDFLATLPIVAPVIDAAVVPFIEFGFMRRALAGCLALSLGATPIGVFLMLRRMSLAGDAISHAILPGAAVGYLISGLSLSAMTIGGLVAGIAVALLAGGALFGPPGAFLARPAACARTRARTGGPEPERHRQKRGPARRAARPRQKLLADHRSPHHPSGVIVATAAGHRFSIS